MELLFRYHAVYILVFKIFQQDDLFAPLEANPGIGSDFEYQPGTTILENAFPELGRGSVDFEGLLDVLEEIDFTGWAVVEQDILPDSGKDPLASAKRNLAYLEEIGY